MKKILASPLLLLLLPQAAYASSTSVHVTANGDSNVSVNSQVQGESTTCINGKCTTTGNSGKSTVCINGKCTESAGDINIEENNGNTKVNIKTSTGNNNVTVTGGNASPTTTPKPTQHKATKSADNEIDLESKTMIQIVVFALSGILKNLASIF